jgi:hypothetical protein
MQFVVGVEITPGGEGADGKNSTILGCVQASTVPRSWCLSEGQAASSLRSRPPHPRCFLQIVVIPLGLARTWDASL